MGTFGLMAWIKPGKLIGTTIKRVSPARQLNPPRYRYIPSFW